MQKTLTYKRIYVWEFPVRLFHWANVLSIVVLAITGFIIANPPALASGKEASSSDWFGMVRMLHFSVAYLFFANLLFRLYWGFVGNRYASLRVFLPLTKKALKNLLYVFKVDILLLKDKEEDFHNISIGHNALAGFSYLLLSTLLLIQAATGFALYEPNASWWLPKLFSWIVPFFGGDIVVRYVHHFITWMIILFSIIHMYLVFYHDYVEGRGEASAMISGYKFCLKDRFLKRKIKKSEADQAEES